MRRKLLFVYMLCAVLVVLAAVFVPSCTQPAEEEEEEEEQATFIAHFMTPEGEPYPFDVIISDGTYHKEFENVTSIDTEVPLDATYTLYYRLDDVESYRQLGFVFPPDETREFEFYALDTSQMEMRTRPYLFLQEVGADAELSWEYDPDSNQLAWKLSGETGKLAGSFADFNSEIAEDINVAIRDANLVGSLLAAHADDRGPFPSYCWWAYCSISNGNDNWQIDNDEMYMLDFSEIDPSLSTITTGYGLHNNHIEVYPIGTTLRDLDGTMYEKRFVFPQYAVPPNNYILSMDELPEGYVALDLPILVEDNTRCMIASFYLMPNDLNHFTFAVVAESFFPFSSYSDLTHDTEEGMISVDVSTETEYDWWGCFVLPGTDTLTDLFALEDDVWRTLYEGEDYTINAVGDYNIVVVRITPETGRLGLSHNRVTELPAYNYLNCYLTANFSVFSGDWSGDVVLDDQFEAYDVLMGEPCCFCDPVSVHYYEDGGGLVGGGWSTVIASPDHHLTTYTLDVLGPSETWSVMVENQFGMQQLMVEGPYLLGVPTQKVEPYYHEPPVGLDHFLIYAVMEGPEVNLVVDLGDEFGPHLDVVIARPAYFGNPVRKGYQGTMWEVENPAAHLVFYSLQVEDWTSRVVQCSDQFGDYFFDLASPWLLAVPSLKSYAQPVP